MAETRIVEVWLPPHPSFWPEGLKKVDAAPLALRAKGLEAVTFDDIAFDGDRAMWVVRATVRDCEPVPLPPRHPQPVVYEDIPYLCPNCGEQWWGDEDVDVMFETGCSINALCPSCLAEAIKA